MSLKLGTQNISGISQNTKYNAHHLLDFKWTDCIMNDVSWLRADTFSWQSGDVYVTAYNHLVADLQGTTAETETIESYTVTFYRATDGHKIVLADQETTVANIYTATGVAWYYILDTTDERFKLPRTKFGFTGYRDNVGNYVAPGLPNITGDVGCIVGNTSPSGSFYVSQVTGSGSNRDFTDWTILFDASRSSSIYGNSTTVQPPATQMYLYFYVGDFEQTALEQTAGITSTQLNNKADIDLTNASDTGKLVMSSMSMPSNHAVALTFGASGTSYTAPADGYASIQGYCSSAEHWVALIENGMIVQYQAGITNQWGALVLPVKKGTQFQLQYEGFNCQQFYFTYTVGSESEAS